MEDQEPRDADDSDELEASIMQADHAFGSESFGTTAEEEVVSVVDEGVLDDEAQLVGDAVSERDEFASPEEAAMSERDNGPGVTDHDDPHAADEA